MPGRSGAHPRRRRDRRSRLRALLTAIMLIALFAAAALTVDGIMDAWRARALKRELGELYRSGSACAWLWPGMSMAKADAEHEAPIEQCGGQEMFAQTLEIQPDFEALYQRNGDIVGWLTAGGDIDYPVVQRDNEYYLYHDYYGAPDANGTIFLNEFNVIAPRDSVLLIHGHNMKSGAMFGGLPKYADERYMREHALITFRSIYDAEDGYYVPVAAFDASMIPGAEGYFDITPMNFDDADRQAEFLAELKSRSLWQSPADAAAGDELIALVTCSYRYADGRFVLYCRRLRADETPESAVSCFAGDG